MNAQILSTNDQISSTKKNSTIYGLFDESQYFVDQTFMNDYTNLIPTNLLGIGIEFLVFLWELFFADWDYKSTRPYI